MLSVFGAKMFALGVVIKIPVPMKTAKANYEETSGRAKYNPAIDCLVWKFPCLQHLDCMFDFSKVAMRSFIPNMKKHESKPPSSTPHPRSLRRSLSFLGSSSILSDVNGGSPLSYEQGTFGNAAQKMHVDRKSQ
ncbi:AP-2 complex subunit mu [Capsicum chinense]|nr:AP-2 complex subunit mu [Capsicum chinense]